MYALRHDLRQLWKQKAAFRLSAIYLILWVLLALFLLLLPLPYHPNFLDLQHTLQPPFQPTSSKPMHLLGTDAIGRDVFSNVLFGARTGLLIGLPVMTLAAVIGVILGTCAGFFGDDKLKGSRAWLFVALPVILSSFYYYGIYVPMRAAELRLPALVTTSSLAVFAAILLTTAVLIKLLKHFLPVLRKQVTIPFDFIVVRLIEVVSSIPWLILVLILASFLQPSVLVLAVILVLTSWMGIARLARAEILRIRVLPYMEAATSIGVSTRSILFKHAFPNMAGPILTSFTFGLASLLTIESTLSFLGIGIPPTVVSWGRIITGIRSDTSAWWLVFFPGMFLALTVMALQVFSYYLLSIKANKK